MFNFDIQRFSSKTVVNPVNGATQLTETGKEIEAINRDYLRVLSPILQNLANTGGAQVGTSGVPNYNSMYQGGLQQVNQAGQNISNLANGQLPAAYQQNMNLAVENALSPFSQTFNNMARSGVINSSIGNKWSTDASTAANNAAIGAYNTNMQNALGLNQASAAAAANPFNYAAGYQSAASSNAKDLLSLATGSYTPVGSTFSDYLKAGTGQQSTTTDNSGFGSVLGTGLGIWASGGVCFVKNTKIATPAGDVPIEQIKVGDTVSTLVGDAEVEKTISTDDMPVVRLLTDRGEVTCTESEVLLTVDGPMQVIDIEQGDVLIRSDGGAIVTGKVDAGRETVYEIVVPWFYANGFVVDGFDPEGE